MTNGKLNIYADDTAVFNKDKDAEKLVRKTNLLTLRNYFYMNKLIVNSKKTQVILFKTAQRKITFYQHFKIHDQVLEPAEVVKYLGLFLGPSFKWNYHIENVIKQISPVVGKLFRLRNIIPASANQKIYYSLIHSRLNFLNIV